MSRVIILAAFATLLLTASAAMAQSARPNAGDQHHIVVSYQTTEESTDGSTGSSSGHSTMLERVIAVSDLGLELEYDLPDDTTAEDRARTWKYPARVFLPTEGPQRLLNADELEARLDNWLTLAGWSRDVCGSWIFTWNAFFIECDPASVLAEIGAISFQSVELSEGAAYAHPDTMGPATLARSSNGPNGGAFTAVLQVDANAVRRSRAESDVAVGEMMEEPVTLEQALLNRSTEQISGTVAVTFEVDQAGRPSRRTAVTILEIIDDEGVTESRRSTVTVERRSILPAR